MKAQKRALEKTHKKYIYLYLENIEFQKRKTVIAENE